VTKSIGSGLSDPQVRGPRLEVPRANESVCNNYKMDHGNLVAVEEDANKPNNASCV
jgi:hypothetical protein